MSLHAWLNTQTRSHAISPPPAPACAIQFVRTALGSQLARNYFPAWPHTQTWSRTISPLRGLALGHTALPHSLGTTQSVDIIPSGAT